MSEGLEQFGSFSSSNRLDLLNWGYAFRNVLTLAAEAIEADASDANQLATLISLISELITLAACLPMPDEPMDPLDIVPLQRLLEGLVMVQAGYRDRMLDPRESENRSRQKLDGTFERTPGRPTLGLKELRVKAMGIAFVWLLIDVGTPEPKAKSIVAEEFTQADLSGRKHGPIRPKRVNEWVNDAKRPGMEPLGRLASEYFGLLRRRLLGNLVPETVLETLRAEAQVLAKR